MSDQPPPPGYIPPGSGVPPAAPPAAAAPWGRPAAPPIGPAYGQQLHKPGTVPLRPLTLTDIFDAAFTTIRRNPRATIGMGAVVTAVFMAVPILGAAILAATGNLGSGLVPKTTETTADFTGTAGVLAGSLVSGLFSALATVVVTGMVVPVVNRAALGERLPAGAAWQQVRGRVLRLVGLSFLEGLIALLVLVVPVGLVVLAAFAASSVLLGVLLGIFVLLASICAALAIHVKWFQLAAPVLVTERRGVFASIRRAGRLSAGQFWRILGIFLLTSLAAGLVGQVIGVPFGIVGAILGTVIHGGGGTLALLVTSNLSTVVSGALVAPFSGSVAVLQYLDQRFRKEGFDIELIEYSQAQSS